MERMGNLMERKLRKRQNRLVDAGIGVILFAIWNVVKVNLYLGLSTFLIEEFHKAAAEYGISEKHMIIITIAIITAVLICQLTIRLYVGLSAIAEGTGKPKNYRYLVLVVVLLIMEIQTIYQGFDLDRVLAGEGMPENLITGLCMEAASMYVLLELLISGICVKKLRKKMKA